MLSEIISFVITIIARLDQSDIVDLSGVCFFSCTTVGTYCTKFHVRTLQRHSACWSLVSDLADARRSVKDLDAGSDPERTQSLP